MQRCLQREARRRFDRQQFVFVQHGHAARVGGLGVARTCKGLVDYFLQSAFIYTRRPLRFGRDAIAIGPGARLAAAFGEIDRISAGHRARAVKHTAAVGQPLRGARKKAGKFAGHTSFLFIDIDADQTQHRRGRQHVFCHDFVDWAIGHKRG